MGGLIRNCIVLASDFVARKREEALGKHDKRLKVYRRSMLKLDNLLMGISWQVSWWYNPSQKLRNELTVLHE